MGEESFDINDIYKIDNVRSAISFRDNIASRLGCSYDWIENINEIIRLQKNNEELDRLLTLLGNPDDAIAEIERLQKLSVSVNAKKVLSENHTLSDDAIIDSVYELRCERTYYRSILDHLCNRLELHGADAFEKLKQVEVRRLKSFAALEIENQQLKHEYYQKVDEYHQEVSSLVDKLRIANKVIARLVGE